MDSLKEIIESILFVAGEAVELFEIAEKLGIDVEQVKEAVLELKKDKENSFNGIQVQLFNNKAQLCSNPNYAEFVAQVLNPIRERALTKAVLEVAAIVAYKQPLTRLEIEQVRGVNSDYAVNVLIENNFIEVLGRKDAIGKPLLFGTTDIFLKRFNIASLDELPDYEELLNRIKVIRNPENSLFDFSNIPASDKAIRDDKTVAVLSQDEKGTILTTVVSDDEFATALNLEKETRKDEVNEFIEKINNNSNDNENESEASLNINKNDEELTQLEEKIDENKTEDASYDLFDLI